MKRGLLVAGLVILALAGCQKKEDVPPLHSQTRVIQEADEAGAPTLKPGVWATHSSDCAYDPNLAPSSWPECVEWVSIADHQRRWPQREEPENFLLSGGDPRVLQASGVDGQDGFLFWGLRSAGVDASGRIVKFRIWPVLCDLAAAPVQDGASDAAAPDLCVVHTPAQLRERVKAAEPEDAPQWVWLRETPQ